MPTSTARPGGPDTAAPLFRGRFTTTAADFPTGSAVPAEEFAE